MASAESPGLICLDTSINAGLRDSADHQFTQLREISGLGAYGEQFTARTGIRVIVEAQHPVPRLPQEAEMTLFRISQEALTNVQKHAKAALVRMMLAVDPESVSLAIADDGCGFDVESASLHATSGLGLLIMQERLRGVKGALRIESRRGTGTRVTARIRRV